MFVRIVLFVLAFFPFTYALEGVPFINRIQNMFTSEPAPPPPTIKVLLVNDDHGAILEVKGKYKVYDSKDMHLIGTRYLGKRKFLQASEDGLIWGEEFPGVHQIAIVPDDKKTTIIVDGAEYAGSIYVYGLGDSVSVVNHIDVEDYLTSILPAEFSGSLPSEILNAIAIASRTNAYYQSQASKSPYWDVEASRVKYKGSILAKKSAEVNKAVKDTQYMILNKIGKNDWEVSPFPSYWRPLKGGPIVANGQYSKITIEEAQKLAALGKDASQILQAAFPDTTIELVHYAP